MYSFNNFINEQANRKELDALMANHGYGRPAVGAEGHVTYTNKEDESDQVLIDLSGKEWYSMVNGKVVQKGPIDDGSLEKFLT